MSTHQAAVLHEKGQTFQIESISTPQPGPHELLISVHAIALNPVDGYMRAAGLLIQNWPAILGSDIAGTVEAVGSSIDPSSSPFRTGVRVLAFAPMFYFQLQQSKLANNYAAYQEKVIVPVAAAAVLPDTISFVDGATLPLAVSTAWAGWLTIGLNFETKFPSSDKKGVVVWGAASSVGAAAVQTATALGFTVYATASSKNFELVRKLGATQVFDYKDAEVGSKLLDAARTDGITLSTIYRAAGDRGGAEVPTLLEIVSKSGGGAIASAVGPLPDDTPQAKGVDLKFVWPPTGDERDRFMESTFQSWLAPRLVNAEFVPGIKARVVGKGLESLNGGLDELLGGVSAEKLVVEL